MNDRPYGAASDGRRASATTPLLAQGEMRRLGLRGQISVTAWKPPEDMPEPEWTRAGVVLRKLEQGIGWWLGDWYGFGERRYGKRKAIVNAPDWQGLNYQTCRNTLVVCAAFELSRRRYNLSFKHHAEVASLAPADA